MDKSKAKYRYGEIYVNREKNYISYYHPTQRNELGHVKQVTRSIKNYSEEKLEKLSFEMDKILRDYSDYTNDFENIHLAEKEFTTKAYQWLVSETIMEKIEIIKEATLTKYIAIEYGKNEGKYNTNILIGTNDNDRSKIFKKYIDNEGESTFPAISNYHINNSTYVAVDDIDALKLEAVIEFKVYADFEEEIISNLVMAYNDSMEYFIKKENDKQILLGILKKYYSKQMCGELKPDMLKDGYNIWLEYCKLHKINKMEFTKSIEFNNYIVTKLQNEKNNNVVYIYNLMTSDIIRITDKLSKTNYTNNNIEFSYKAYQIKEPEIAKILYFQLKYKDNSKPDYELKKEYFKLLESISSYELGENSLYNYVNKFRVKGNFGNNYGAVIDTKSINEENYFDKELLVTLQMIDKITVPIDGITTIDYALSRLLEKIIINAMVTKSDFIFIKGEVTERNIEFLKECLSKMLSKNLVLGIYEYLYVSMILNIDMQIQPIKFSDKFDRSYNKSELIESINTTFYNNAKKYFDKINNKYVRSANIIASIQDILYESFIASLYGYVLTPIEIAEYSNENKYYMIVKYNEFFYENILKIRNALDTMIKDLIGSLTQKLELVEDYGFYAKCVRNEVLNVFRVPLNYINELEENIIDFLEN